MLPSLGNLSRHEVLAALRWPRGSVGFAIPLVAHSKSSANAPEVGEAVLVFVQACKTTLAKLLPCQKADFVGIFKALKGYPATIRFLDPPLHEFLPHEDAA